MNTTNTIQLRKQLFHAHASTHPFLPPSSLSIPSSLSASFNLCPQHHAAVQQQGPRARWIIIFAGSLRGSSDSGGNCVRDPTDDAARRRAAQIKAEHRHADCGWSTVTLRVVHLPSPDTVVSAPCPEFATLV